MNAEKVRSNAITEREADDQNRERHSGHEQHAKSTFGCPAAKPDLIAHFNNFVAAART
jgi:hypothetical protein